MSDLISPSDLFRAQTRAEVEDSMLAFAAELGFTVTAWQPGGVARTIIAVVAQTVANLTVVLASMNRSGFLDLASGGWLTLLAYYVYGVERIAASAGECQYEVTNASASSYGPFAAGTLHVAHATTKKTYTNKASITIAPSATTTFEIVADEVGSGSNAAIGTITTIVTTLIGCTGTNPAAAVGVDAESDAALRARCRAKLGALSPNGARDAYVYVATSTTPSVTRARTVASTGAVTVYVAGPAGPVAGGDVDVVDAAIAEQAVPLGVTAAVDSADGVTQAVACNVHMLPSASLTLGQLTVLVQDKLLEFFKAAPVGGYAGTIKRDLLQATIASAAPGYVYHVELTTPAVDVALDPNEVAVLGTTTIGMTVVSL